MKVKKRKRIVEFDIPRVDLVKEPAIEEYFTLIKNKEGYMDLKEEITKLRELVQRFVAKADHVPIDDVITAIDKAINLLAEAQATLSDLRGRKFPYGYATEKSEETEKLMEAVEKIKEVGKEIEEVLKSLGVEEEKEKKEEEKKEESKEIDEKSEEVEKSKEEVKELKEELKKEKERREELEKELKNREEAIERVYRILERLEEVEKKKEEYKETEKTSFKGFFKGILY